jgi:putative membrane protein
MDHMNAYISYAASSIAHPGGWGNGPGWWILIPITFWVLVITAAVIWWRRRPASPGPESALGEAFARGQMSEEEYRSRLAVLRETDPGRRR